jgi:hypothetical protein
VRDLQRDHDQSDQPVVRSVHCGEVVTAHVSSTSQFDQ